MSEAPRIGMLTPHVGLCPADGVEVFNQYLQHALGNLEIFVDSLPDGHRHIDELDRVGLELPYQALHAARVLVRRHREEPFQLIICNGVHGWPPSLTRLGVPLVQVYHLTMAGLARDALPIRGDRLTTGRVTGFFDRLAGVGKHVVAVSHRVLREVESFYGLRGRVIPNGIDTSSFRPMGLARARDKLGLPHDATIGIFVGRPDHTKGYDTFLRVARRMPQVLFLVAGGYGPAQGNVRPLGRIPHSDMPWWYSASDFFFLPSRYEGFGLSTIEALSCGVPVVVSEAAFPFSGNRSQCGIVVDGDREQDFVQAIHQVVGDGDSFSPREFAVPRFSIKVFEDTWRGFVNSVFGFAFPSWFLLLVSLGLDEAISTNVAADRSRARRYLTTVALLRLLLVAIALVALWVATQIVLADPLARSVTMLLGSASVISSYANTFNSIFRAFERFEYPALVTIVERSVTVGISLRLLSLGRSLLEVCVVFLIGSLITLALSGAIATRKFARALQRIQKLALIAGVPLALGGWFYADAIIALFYGTAFLPAADSFRILVFSFCVDTAMMGNAPALAAIGKMKLVLYIGCVAAASTIALSLLLIPPFGAVGAAYAFFVSHLLAAGLGAVAVRRLISPLGTSRMMVKSAFAGFVMLFVLVALPRLPLLLGVATGAAVYFAVLFAIRGASKEDRALVGEALRGALPIAVVRRFIGMVRGALMR